LQQLERQLKALRRRCGRRRKRELLVLARQKAGGYELVARNTRTIGSSCLEGTNVYTY
jgi:hypothetical protein